MPATKPKKSGNGKSTEKIYQQVTDTIIEALEKGTVPWHRPWRVEGGVHMNLKGRRPYRGINQFLLDLAAMENSWKAPYWMTYKQAEEIGAHVQKGEKSTLVTFWKILDFDKKDEDGNVVTDDRGRPVKSKIPLLRYYRVFNAEQIVIDPKANWEKIWKALDGITLGGEPVEDFNPIEAAQALIDNMPNRPEMTYGGNRAFYQPKKDHVQLPEAEQFDTPEDFYHTAYHELAHSTGHESRTGRVKDWTSFGSEPYGKEELVAEMTAAMLAGFVEIDVPTQDNTAAYLRSWLNTIKGDNKLVVQAASKAQQAADYIIGEEVNEQQ